MFALHKSRPLIASLLLVSWSFQSAHADPVGDFFRKIGDSISHAGKKTPPRKTNAKSPTGKKGAAPDQQGQNAEVQPSPALASPTPSPSATPLPLVVRRGASVSSPVRGDLPYAVPVPNKPGFVTSPYAPGQGLVDIRGIPSGTEVKDPFTGKIFLTP